MSSLFEALPGFEVTVGGICKGLEDMWDQTAEGGGPAPAADDARATQVNFVLHLGMNTTPADAEMQFRTAVRFSVRYPSRVVVLCPMSRDEGTHEMRAKIYAECHLGKSRSDKRCVEFVILSYPRKAREFLESQVSICLSSDLPLYYWPHRFSQSAKLADYRYLLTRAKRVLIDSSISPPDAMQYPWPRPEAVRDLVYARVLPVRQSLGQFLSRYPMAVICEGLRKVVLAHSEALSGEGRVLIAWLRERVGLCGDSGAQFELQPAPAGQPGTIEIAFDYQGDKSFLWKGDIASGQAHFDSRLLPARTALPASVSLLPPEMALSEAMFFQR